MARERERARRTQGQGTHWYRQRAIAEEPYKEPPRQRTKEMETYRAKRIEALLAARNK